MNEVLWPDNESDTEFGMCQSSLCMEGPCSMV